MWRILIILIFKIKLIKEIKMIFGILKPNRAVTEVERIFTLYTTKIDNSLK